MGYSDKYRVVKMHNIRFYLLSFLFTVLLMTAGCYVTSDYRYHRGYVQTYPSGQTYYYRYPSYRYPVYRHRYYGPYQRYYYWPYPGFKIWPNVNRYYRHGGGHGGYKYKGGHGRYKHKGRGRGRHR